MTSIRRAMLGPRTMCKLLTLFISIVAGASAQYYGNYYCQPDRDVIVHLFEWKWTDIEEECSWLAANGYCAVLVGMRAVSSFLIAIGQTYRLRRLVNSLSCINFYFKILVISSSRALPLSLKLEFICPCL